MPFKMTKIVQAISIHSSIDMVVLSPWCNRPKAHRRNLISCPWLLLIRGSWLPDSLKADSESVLVADQHKRPPLLYCALQASNMKVGKYVNR